MPETSFALFKIAPVAPQPPHEPGRPACVQFSYGQVGGHQQRYQLCSFHRRPEFEAGRKESPRKALLAVGTGVVSEVLDALTEDQVAALVAAWAEYADAAEKPHK